MRKFLLLICVNFLFISSVYAQPAGKGFILAEEEDGSPQCFGYSLKFANGNITDNADGTCSIADQDSGGATAYDDIGDPDANNDINHAGYTNTWTSTFAGTFFTIDGVDGQTAIAVTDGNLVVTDTLDSGTVTQGGVQVAVSGGAYHDGFSDFLATEHVDWAGAGAGTIHTDNYIEGGAGTDTTAIHDNVAGEIVAITEKTLLVYDDEFIIEDSEDSNNKKSVKLNNLAVSASQLKVRNETGVSIAAGKAVYMSGFNNFPLVALADNTDSVKHVVLGVTNAAIADSANGYIATSGEFSTNTNGFTAVGDILYLTTAGGLTETQPTSGVMLVLGVVTVKEVNGKILLVQNNAPNYVAAASAQDLDIRMGATDGSTKTSFEDYADVEVAQIDDNGEARFQSIQDLDGPGTNWKITTAGAVTAVSYGGITEANLVDKSATEVITGAWDFGGAASIEIVNAAGDLTLDANGEIGVDTTQRQFCWYDGTTEVCQPSIRLWHGALNFAGMWDVDNQWPLIWLDTDVFPDGLVITKWYLQANVADPTTEFTGDLKYCDDNTTAAFPGANAVLIDVLDTTTGNSSETTMSNSDLGSGAIPAGKKIYLLIDADPTDGTTFFELSIFGYIPES